MFCSQVAVPAKDWNETYDATEEGPACSTLSETPISEDCLRLNVYTTKVIEENIQFRLLRSRVSLTNFIPKNIHS